MPTLADLVAFFDQHLPRPDQPSATIVVPRDEPVARLGLRLDPSGDLPAWIRKHALDALFLHRHYKLDADSLPPTVGVIASHDAFDAHLSIGDNAHWARAVGLREPESFGEKAGRSLGMIGEVEPRGWQAFHNALMRKFGGVEAAQSPLRDRVACVAVMSAMNDNLMRQAYTAGVDVYVTGQFRQPAREAVAETGIGVVAVGHRRSERWALRQLSALISRRFAKLNLTVG